jgi:small subunit ribosomal protein S21
MVEVYVDDLNFEVALKLLKNKLNRDGILKQLKIRSTFESQSQRRRRKDGEAERRRKRRAMRQRDVE